MPLESIYEVFDQQKTDLLLHLLETSPDAGGVVVYVKTKENLHAVTTALSHAGVIAESIHAGKKPELRERAITEFGEGKVNVLTMSESIARGLEISGIRLVVNYDIPELEADYAIRLGGIQASNGEMITMSTPKKALLLEKINRISGTEVQLKIAEGFIYATRLEKPGTGQKGKSKSKHSKPLQNKKPKLRKGAKGGK